MRGLDAHIEGFHREARGVAPFPNVANDAVIAVEQGGKRIGAVCAHPEVFRLRAFRRPDHRARQIINPSIDIERQESETPQQLLIAKVY